MAEIVLGIETSHAPRARMAPEKRQLVVEKEKKEECR